MEHEFENSVWESFLKTAVSKNSLSEAEAVESDPEFIHTEIPARYDRKMRRIIGRSRRRTKQRAVLKYTYRTAFALLFAAAACSVFFMQFEEVRSACSQVLTHVYEKYIEFRFTPDQNTKTGQLVLDYIPQGFSLKRSDPGDGLDTLIYENSEGCVIAAACFKSYSSIQMDQEHFTVSDIRINAEKGTYFQAQESDLRDYILWNSGGSYFMLSSQLDLEEMIKIAENIRIK